MIGQQSNLIQEYDSLHQIFSEWSNGIEMLNRRIAPMRELEPRFHLEGEQKLEWRCQGNMRKEVWRRKMLVYAILRLTPNPAGTYDEEHEEVHNAISKLESVRRDKVLLGEMKIKKDKMSIAQLQEYLVFKVKAKNKNKAKADQSSCEQSEPEASSGSN
ncbi:hypothetical protein WJX79_006129 [Trebouxia sp. C0005]